MLGDVCGGLGEGKTLLLTALAAMHEGKGPIYANFHLKVKGATYITVEDLEGIQSGLILIDEAYLWLESRLSGSPLNRYLSRIIFQSRKRGYDIFLSEQVESSVDLRYRAVRDIRFFALGLDKTETVFKYAVQGWDATRHMTIPMTQARVLFKKFDTLEYPDIAPTTFEPRRYNKSINKIVGRLRRSYGSENLTSNLLSKNMIKDFMIEKGLYEGELLEGVYARLKRTCLEKQLSVRDARK